MRVTAGSDDGGDHCGDLSGEDTSNRGHDGSAIEGGQARDGGRQRVGLRVGDVGGVGRHGAAVAGPRGGYVRRPAGAGAGGLDVADLATAASSDGAANPSADRLRVGEAHSRTAG